MESKEKNGVNKSWKILAIIFILLFLLENIYLAIGMSMVSKDNKNEAKCSNEICYNLKSDSYIYDKNTQMCYCYSNGQISHTEQIP
jgi:regulatory protein YycI of two-component signal transduction system YycFG